MAICTVEQQIVIDKVPSTALVVLRDEHSREVRHRNESIIADAST